ncbi:MAG TPA: hypothetical protein VM011_00735, partial [Gammaproteobacteria bacterium]|nr:hypothetical protein [Gammaproteobacteria bacterium]
CQATSFSIARFCMANFDNRLVPPTEMNMNLTIVAAEAESLIGGRPWLLINFHFENDQLILTNVWFVPGRLTKLLGYFLRNFLVRP